VRRGGVEEMLGGAKWVCEGVRGKESEIGKEKERAEGDRT
jgi:hypothetical protein